MFPSRVFHDSATPTKNKKGKEYLQLRIGPEGSDTFEKFREYRDNFQKLLAGATPEVRTAVKKAFKFVEGEHLKQEDFKREILFVISGVDKPLQTIVASVIGETHMPEIEAHRFPAST